LTDDASIPEMGYNLCKFCENRARDTPLWGVSIPYFDQISVKISVFVVLHRHTLVVAPMWVKFGVEEGTSVPSSTPNFTPIGATCRPCGAKKTQNPKIGL